MLECVKRPGESDIIESRIDYLDVVISSRFVNYLKKIVTFQKVIQFDSYIGIR